MGWSKIEALCFLDHHLFRGFSVICYKLTVIVGEQCNKSKEGSKYFFNNLSAHFCLFACIFLFRFCFFFSFFFFSFFIVFCLFCFCFIGLVSNGDVLLFRFF